MSLKIMSGPSIASQKLAEPCQTCRSTRRYKGGRCAPCGRRTTQEWRAANPRKSLESVRRWKGRNKEKVASGNQRWRTKNPERVRANKRDYALRTNHGITTVEYEDMLQSQKGTCAICFATPNGRALAVDHCHTTKKVRGLLCGNCNNGVDRLKDNPEWLRRAATYLESVGEK